jgi:hypothetical protein
MRFCGIDMVNGNAAMGLEIGENAVSTTVKIITCDDLITGFEDSQYGIESSHARRYGKSMRCGRYFGEMMF